MHVLSPEYKVQGPLDIGKTVLKVKRGVVIFGKIMSYRSSDIGKNLDPGCIAQPAPESCSARSEVAVEGAVAVVAVLAVAVAAVIIKAELNGSGKGMELSLERTADDVSIDTTTTTRELNLINNSSEKLGNTESRENKESIENCSLTRGNIDGKTRHSKGIKNEINLTSDVTTRSYNIVGTSIGTNLIVDTTSSTGNNMKQHSAQELQPLQGSDRGNGVENEAPGAPIVGLWGVLYNDGAEVTMTESELR